MLDLSNGVVRKSLVVSAKRMCNDDWRKLNRLGTESLTQAIGRAVYESGFKGLIAPAQAGGNNLVWFPGNFKGTSMAKIRNVNQL